MNKQKLLCPELSYSIIGSAMEVHNELGPGWNEWDYHRAMIESLSSKGHAVLSHNRRDLIHRGSAVGHFELDILVENLVILELKHIKTSFHPIHYTQIINYLKLWDRGLGILINYGLETLRYNRVPYTPAQGNVQHQGMWFRIAEQEPCCRLVSNAIEYLLVTHGIGYGIEAFKKLLFAELQYIELEPGIPRFAPRYGELSFEEREIDAILIGSELLLLISASGVGTSAADLASLKSYMNQMHIPYGILINLGKSGIQLRGVL